ncbi:MAG: hypothetical protein Q4B22_08325 [Eubacteriales bacterium]|nr:hypothetical protein [Eubacteriales bacterium]
MSVYALTIKTGSLVATTLRTAVLVTGNLDAVTKDGADPAYFASCLSTYIRWAPIGFGIAALLVLMFLFNLNDDRIKFMNDDLKAGILAKNSKHSF